jgi:hypothetical protein
MCVVDFMLFVIDREHTMWIVEINFAGRQFTHHVDTRRRPIFHFSPRVFSWRPSQLRDPRAA